MSVSLHPQYLQEVISQGPCGQHICSNSLNRRLIKLGSKTLAALLLRRDNCDIILCHFPENPCDINLFHQQENAFLLGILLVLPPLPSEGTSCVKILSLDVFLRQYILTEKEKNKSLHYSICIMSISNFWA